jgi:hypothetical protein
VLAWESFLLEHVYGRRLGRTADATDAGAHLLLVRSGHGRAVVPLELVAAADDRGPAEAPTVAYSLCR